MLFQTAQLVLLLIVQNQHRTCLFFSTILRIIFDKNIYIKTEICETTAEFQELGLFTNFTDTYKR